MIYKTFDTDLIHHPRGGKISKPPKPASQKTYLPLIDLCAEYLTKDSIVLETGCFFAVSTIIFAHFAKVVYTVDINFRNEAIEEIAKHKNIKMITCDSKVVHSKFKDKKFDLVYLDSDHSEVHVAQEIATLFPLVKNGGIIAGHDYSSIQTVRQAVDEKFDKPDKLYTDNSWLKVKL